ncbi:MAG: hypothetical protein U0821_16240 [Chloroflexota bacterium]
MIAEAVIRPPYSIIVLEGTGTIDVPPLPWGTMVASTPTCIILGTLCEVDGETLVQVADEHAAVEELQKIFVGDFNTTGSVLRVMSAEGDAYLEVAVPQPRLSLDIFADDPSHLARILIRVESGEAGAQTPPIGEAGP